jgi:hypothetical protein
MTSRGWILALSFCAVFVSLVAYAEDESTWVMPKTFENSAHSYLAAIGAINVSSPQFDGNDNVTAKAAPAGGVLVGTRFTELFGMDVSFLYLQRASSSVGEILPGTQATTTLTMKQFQIAPVARFWFNDYFSMGVGGYYAYGLGSIDAHIVSTAFPTGSQDASVPYEGRAHRSDGGLVGSVAFHYPVTDNSRFIVDGRYTQGLVNLDETGGSVKFRDIQALLGFGIDL